jgi:hypothetical protein
MRPLLAMGSGPLTTMPGHPRPDPAQDLVADRAEQGGPVVRRDLLVALAAQQHHLVARPTEVSSPQSTMIWSIVTMPANGRRTPPMSTSKPLVKRARGTPSA